MRLVIELVASRTYPFIDPDTLVERRARDTLCRLPDGIIRLAPVDPQGRE